MHQSTIDSLRQEAVDLFYHGYDNYMRHAFPEDELRPLTCGPLTRDRENPAHIELNDALGNYSLTLIDSLSTLAILASTPEAKRKPKGWLATGTTPLEDFQDGVKLMIEYYGDGTNGTSGQGKRARGFDLDSKVQVFETVIRGVGGLLSAHLFAVGDLPIRGYTAVSEKKHGREGIHWRNGLVYNGQLLRLAKDLANRLLPAFYTPTDLPYPRVNLRHGVPFYANSPMNANAESGTCRTKQTAQSEITETCSAGAGSLVLEFTTLSRLTGDAKYEKMAMAAFFAVWKRRSSIGLIGAGIDSETGEWVTPITGIGAGIDSFFEYAFKSHVLLSNLPYHSEDLAHPSDLFLQTWQSAHAAIRRHVHRNHLSHHPHYIQTDMNSGAARYYWVDSLSAFYPGLLTLSGELEEAISTHLLYTALWNRYSAMPERWSTFSGDIESGLRWWGGRPEFIESTWYLYRATQDPWYLHVGEMTLRDIKRRCWTKCGWAGLQDVRTGEKMNRMESFFLGETAKYLFLLFDVNHPLNKLDAPFVFTTEGHPLVIPKRVIPPKPALAMRKKRGVTNTDNCPAPPPLIPFSISPTAARGDLFHAASLARIKLRPNAEHSESPLMESGDQHTSISVSDVSSPSNYTYFPWTLPLDLIPSNGVCSPINTQRSFDLTFPNFLGDAKASSILPVTRVINGALVNTMSGIRLGLVKEPVSFEGVYLIDQFRIHSVSSLTLGRDEKVFVPREVVAAISAVDPYFTRLRDSQILDLLVDLYPNDTGARRNASIASEGAIESIVPQLTGEVEMLDSDQDTPLFSSILRNLQSILNNAKSVATEKPPRIAAVNRHILTASIPTGPGAAPFPTLDEEPPSLTDESLESPLSWDKIYIASDDLCDEVLPTEVPREHQIIVVKRGGCSFATKLQHIPVFPLASKSLQLVIVISYPGQNRPMGTRRDLSEEDIEFSEYADDGDGYDDNTLIQPYLDVSQLTPGGLIRPHPISMIMLTGGARSIDMLKRAKGVAIRRRWWFESQGLKINNLVVL